MPRILLVDDSRTDRAAIAAPLRAHGHEVIECEGPDALPDWGTVAPPDLVLLDVVMPGESGFQLCRRLRGHPRTAEVPVVLISGSIEATDREWGLRQGAAAYLSKPVPEQELIAVVSHLLNATTKGRR